MFYFERQIYYIDFYEKDQRIGNAGFINITRKEDTCQVHIGIRGIGRKKVVKCQWYGLREEEKILLEEFWTQDGQADFKKTYTADCSALVDFRELKGFYFQFGKNDWGNCFVRREGESMAIQQTDTKPHAPRSTFENLLQTYPVVQPFQSQGDYVEIEPMTLKMLAPGYRKLADNSFLLHGYYTHKHIILGFYKDSEREGFYLGVPGSFESKEQLMAEMFGFEGYERSGDSGYYMRKVEF